MSAAAEFLKWSEDRFDLQPDAGLLQKLQQELAQTMGQMGPSDHWTMDEKQFPTMNDMLDPWVGVTGLVRLDALDEMNSALNTAYVAHHLEFLSKIDHLGILPTENPLKNLGERGFRITDLGTLIDISLLGSYLPEPSDRPLNVLEVGGGFGRLAEGLHKWKPGKFRHVLVDAVPLSIMYSTVYLRARFPDASIALYDGTSEIRALTDDFLIVPSWHIEHLKGIDFDLCVNIESFQEMDQVHVENYLALFDLTTCADGLIYLSNSRDYVMRNAVTMPTRWQPLFKHRTPRSWTADHPTEIFRKASSGIFEGQKALAEYFYRKEVAACIPPEADVAPENVSDPAPQKDPKTLWQRAFNGRV